MSAALRIQRSPAFRELWQTDFREYIYYGGRYGGKNYAIAQFLCVQALKKRTRCLVLREFNTNNKGSVYNDIKDFYESHDIEARLSEIDLQVTSTYTSDRPIKYRANRIQIAANSSEFIFAGINDNTIDSLKGLKDVNFCWIDEADFLTEYSYNKLKPTIRAENSKLIYSFNPELEDSFLYQKAINNADPRCFAKKITAAKFDKEQGQWVCGDNPFLNSTILADINSDYKTMTAQMFNFVHLGEPLGVVEGNVINTDLIGFFDDSQPLRYDEMILTADTAFSKKENADYSVICAFGKINDEIHLMRLWRGHWDFNELKTAIIGAYEWLFAIYQRHASRVIIEKKASGISLLQELQRETHLPLKEITPQTDKFARVSAVLGEFPRLRLPRDRVNGVNSWVEPFLKELRSFRADLEHLHDDQVDACVYGLSYFAKKSVDWSKFL